jgi:hypothetical protein
MDSCFDIAPVYAMCLRLRAPPRGDRPHRNEPPNAPEQAPGGLGTGPPGAPESAPESARNQHRVVSERGPGAARNTHSKIVEESAEHEMVGELLQVSLHPDESVASPDAKATAGPTFVFRHGARCATMQGDGKAEAEESD